MNIQLALDRMTIKEAIENVSRVQDYVDWIEVGTSLIKEFGMASVSEISRAFPEKTILADMKTFDNAAYEFEMCYQAGADIATVMGAAPIVTIETCLQAAEKHGKKVMVDLLNTPAAQMQALSSYRNAIFCAHASKDQQEILGDQQSWEKLHLPPLASGLKVAVAGGITLDSLPSIASVKPHAVIIGTAITKAADPVKAARDIYEWKLANKGEQTNERM
jgi:3-hexulose-6-phosphate synthase